MGLLIDHIMRQAKMELYLIAQNEPTQIFRHIEKYIAALQRKNFRYSEEISTVQLAKN